MDSGLSACQNRARDEDIMSKLKISFTKLEKILWAGSLLAVTISYFFSAQESVLTLVAALLGVTAVLFCAKGHVLGQVLIATFSILYGIISWKMRYLGEMITYLGMCLPMALWSMYTWMKNPSKGNQPEVQIQRLKLKHYIGLAVAVVPVTVLFFFIMRYFHTPNLGWSTVSIATSFFAAALIMLRSSYYGFWYAVNDLVLIILWTLAALEDPMYIPVVVNFGVFLCNDLYGFLSWKVREKKQNGMN